jgi:lipoprotein-releasing system ATP-binding protein
MIDQSILGWWGRGRDLKKQAAAILEKVGLSHRVKHKPRELSGGEMQRAAIARALIGRPRVLLADEPTGNLDEETGAEIIKLLRGLNRDEGLTIVMVTHNLDLVAATDRVVRITAGRIEPPAPPGYSLFSEAS